MPRVIVALLRHGAFHQPEGVPSAHLPYGLDRDGEQQARRGVGELLDRIGAAGWRFDEVVDASRLLRAWQTARILAEALRDSLGVQIAVEEFDDLAERSLGSGANLTVEQINEVLRQDPRCVPLPEGWRHDSFYRIPLPGAESLLQAGARVARHIEWRARQILVRASVDTVKVCVGHGGAFRHAAVHLGVLRIEEAPRLSMAHCVPVFLERHGEYRWARIAGDWKKREPAHIE
jgi:2,3-bisphosphoglycerate-dependent phosphoglycerate mutase